MSFREIKQRVDHLCVVGHVVFVPSLDGIDKDGEREIFVLEGVVDAEPVAWSFISDHTPVVGGVNSSVTVLVDISELPWIPSLEDIPAEEFFFSPDSSGHFVVVDRADGFSHKPAVTDIIVILAAIQLGDFIPI